MRKEAIPRHNQWDDQFAARAPKDVQCRSRRRKMNLTGVVSRPPSPDLVDAGIVAWEMYTIFF